MDGAGGHSGGPVYYCPDGDDNVCATNDGAFVIAVWAGWSGFNTTFVGPKAPYFRDWAVTIMDNN